MTPFAVFTADWHLAPGAWTNRPEIADDAYFAMDYVSRYCVANQLPLIIGGDIFDKTHPDSQTVEQFCRTLDQLAAAGTPLYFIQGNHDWRPMAWPRIHHWARWLTGQTIELGGFKIYGLDAQSEQELPAALAAVPVGTDILVAHQRWREYGGGEAADGSVTQIPHARYLLTGDYHVMRIDMWANSTGQDLICFSPGATCLQAVNEPEQHYFFVCYADGQQLHVAPVAIPSRPKYEYRLQMPEALASFTADLQVSENPQATEYLWPQLRKPIIAVYYRDDLPDAYSRIKQAVGDRAHLFLYPQRTGLETVVDVDALQLPANPADAMAATIDQIAPEPVIAATAKQLLAAADPAVELDGLLQAKLSTFAAAAAGAT